MKHKFCKGRIKLSTHSFYNFFSNLVLRNWVAVTSFWSHCIISICNGNDSGNFRNIFALESFGVAATVKAFVVRVGTNWKIRWFWNAGKNLFSDYRMFFDFGKFFVCELSIFIDDVIRNSDFSYIVKKSCKVNIAAELFILVCENGDFMRIFCNAHRVSVGVNVLGIYCVCKCSCSLLEHNLGCLLFFLQKLNFKIVSLIYRFVHICQNEHKKQNCFTNEGNIYQRKAVAEKLKYSGKKREEGKGNKKDCYIFTDSVGILKNYIKLK